jgi:hypothetical protein
MDGMRARLHLRRPSAPSLVGIDGYEIRAAAGAWKIGAAAEAQEIVRRADLETRCGGGRSSGRRRRPELGAAARHEQIEQTREEMWKKIEGDMWAREDLGGCADAPRVSVTTQTWPEFGRQIGQSGPKHEQKLK